MVAVKRVEEYIETIYKIVKEKGYARVKDVSGYLGIGASATSEMIQKMSEEGYVNYERYGPVTLTSKGKKIAVDLDKRHRALREFFTILGLDEKVADENACVIEHVIDPDVMNRLAKFVDFIKAHRDPKWLKRFKTYYETGKLEECPQTIKKDKDTKHVDKNG